jgi:hypothetical protein
MSGFDSEYPGNTHKSKAEDPVEDKKIERVTEGKVIRQKPSMGKRFTSVFIAGDSDSVMRYVMMEVLLPGAKDMVADAVTQYVERMVFGESRSTNRRSSFRGSGASSPGAGYVSYNRFAQKPSHENPRQGISAKSRATHNFDQLVLETRPEAEEVLDRLFDLIAKYEQATVADFYELAGETGSFTDQKWGWTDIRGSEVQRVRNGYLVRLPSTVALD